MNFKVLLSVLVLFLSCKNNEKKAIADTPNEVSEIKDSIIKTEEESIKEQKSIENDFDLEIYDFNGFEPFLNKKDGTTYVINFWATWCAPCIKELPYFEKINAEYAESNVKVVLVSLDFPHLYDTKLKPFIVDKNLKSQVVALDDADMNTWIPKVSTNWSGSLPATVIYKNDSRKFFEQSFNYETLEKEVKQFIN